MTYNACFMCFQIKVESLLVQYSMQDKNSRLAKENSSLKAIISQKTQAQEEILKRSTKAGYCLALSYKEMLEGVERSIQALQQSLEECKEVQRNLVKNRKLLDTTTDECACYNAQSDLGSLSVAHDSYDRGIGPKVQKRHKGDAKDHLFDRWSANK